MPRKLLICFSFLCSSLAFCQPIQHWSVASLAGRNSAVTRMPITSGLILACESSDFDASSGGANITSWSDYSGNSHNWINGQTGTLVKPSTGGTTYPSTVPPTVDQTIKANGHATIRFAGAGSPMYLQQAQFITLASGFTGLEVMIVMRQDADPTAGNDIADPMEFNHPLTDFPHHAPYSDGNIYEGFGRTDRPNCGNPTTSMSSAFRVYNVASSSANNAYDIWVNTENLLHQTGSYTYQQRGNEQSNDQLYFLGLGEWYTQGAFLFKGNIAAVYLWNVRLSSGDRTTALNYIDTKFGTSASH
jgi:hypothetical protein